MEPSFRERYCAFHRIPASEFEEHLLPRGLYLQARLLHAVLRRVPGYFFPEREFLRGVGAIRMRRLFSAEAIEFHSARANGNWLRRFLRLRVSTERVRGLMDECWGAAAADAANARSRRRPHT